MEPLLSRRMWFNMSAHFPDTEDDYAAFVSMAWRTRAQSVTQFPTSWRLGRGLRPHQSAPSMLIRSAPAQHAQKIGTYCSVSCGASRIIASSGWAASWVGADPRIHRFPNHDGRWSIEYLAGNRTSPSHRPPTVKLGTLGGADSTAAATDRRPTASWPVCTPATPSSEWRFPGWGARWVSRCAGLGDAQPTSSNGGSGCTQHANDLRSVTLSGADHMVRRTVRLEKPGVPPEKTHKNLIQRRTLAPAVPGPRVRWGDGLLKPPRCGMRNRLEDKRQFCGGRRDDDDDQIWRSGAPVRYQVLRWCTYGDSMAAHGVARSLSHWEVAQKKPASGASKTIFRPRRFNPQMLIRIGWAPV